MEEVTVRKQTFGGITINYAMELPTSEELRERFRETLRYWQGRNAFIRAIREMIEGKNKIPMPKQTMYRPRVVRSYLLAGSINEKRARFLNKPEIAVIPEGIGMTAQKKASDIERAMNEAMALMESNGQNATWDRAVYDSIALDEGVELIERAPAAFWPDLIEDPETGMPRLARVFQDPEEFAKAKEEYKKLAGFPIRSVYVPLEYFFPIYEGPTIVEAFHIEYRSLRSVLSNKTFSAEAKMQLIGDAGTTPDGGLSTQVCILRYCNQWWYAYYALTPTEKDRNAYGTFVKYPDPILDDKNIGEPVLLYAYQHGLGRVPYNTVAGRFGGWRQAKNGIEPVMNALIELNQAADILLSQVATNVGARYWPNLKITLNPEWRGAGGTTPRPPQIKDGEPIALYLGESIDPIFRPEADPMSQWLYMQIVEQFNRIAGHPVVYGAREPGVDSGYQHNLQITQSEHLDEKIEQNLVNSVRSRCEIIMGHIKAMNEKVYVGITETHKREDKKYTEYICLDPKDLYPTPRFDARVRKPKPIDFLTALRAARDASADRRGKGTPLLSDDTIYEMILNIQEPDVERKKIWLQNEIQKLFESGFLTEKITERLNMKFFEDVPKLSENVSEADPALLAAMQQGAPYANQLGGISEDVANQLGGPETLMDLAKQFAQQPPGTPPPANQQPLDSGPRRVGGTPAGTPQYEQVIANALNKNVSSRLPNG